MKGSSSGEIVIAAGLMEILHGTEHVATECNVRTVCPVSTRKYDARVPPLGEVRGLSQTWEALGGFSLRHQDLATVIEKGSSHHNHHGDIVLCCVAKQGTSAFARTHVEM